MIEDKLYIAVIIVAATLLVVLFVHIKQVKRIRNMTLPEQVPETLDELRIELRYINSELIYVASLINDAIKNNDVGLLVVAMNQYSILSYKESMVKEKLFNIQLDSVYRIIVVADTTNPSTEEYRKHVNDLKNLYEEYRNKKINTLPDTYESFTKEITTQLNEQYSNVENYTDADINNIIINTEKLLKNTSNALSSMDVQIIDFTKKYNDKLATIVDQNALLASVMSNMKTNFDGSVNELNAYIGKFKDNDAYHKMLSQTINDNRLSIDSAITNMQLNLTSNITDITMQIENNRAYAININKTTNDIVTNNYNALLSRIATLNNTINTNFIRTQAWAAAAKTNIDNLTVFNKSMVGTICASVMTETQMNATSNIWLLCDGRSCSGTTYAAISGKTYVPDLRGMFLRGFDPSKLRNPDGTSLGYSQNWALAQIKSETGAISQTYASSFGGNSYDALYRSGSVEANGTPISVDKSNCGTLGIDTWRCYPNNTSTEIRPVNTAVNYFIMVRIYPSVAFPTL